MRKRTGMGLAALLALVTWAPTSVSAQEDGQLPATFTSDRPGFANTTGVAAVGRITTELGALAAFGEEGATGSLPQLSLRVGLFDWLELRVRGPNVIGDFGPGGPRFGLADPWVGFKIGGRVHETVWISSDWEISVPAGTDGFGAPEVGWLAYLNLDWNFWGPLWLTPNAVASVVATADPTTGETQRFFDGGGSLKFTWMILDVLGAYVQSYVLKSEVSDWRVQVGGGLYWRVLPNVQIDASFDTGVTAGTDQAPTVEAGTTILW